MLYTNTGEGLHRFVDPVDGEVYLYSQFETADAKRVYACFDQPDLKAVFTLHVTRARALAGGLERPGEQSVDRDERARPCTSRPRRGSARTSPLSSPARTTSCATHHDGIDLGLYCRKSLAEYLDADEIYSRSPSKASTGTTPTSVMRYAFDKYDQLFVPEFNAGAMENAGVRDVPRGLRVPRQGHGRRAASAGARRSCTRWRTCGSATSSRCAGGTTCG